jgi:undecaprenyl-diphosphatase
MAWMYEIEQPDLSYKGSARRGGSCMFIWQDCYSKKQRVWLVLRLREGCREGCMESSNSLSSGVASNGFRVLVLATVIACIGLSLAGYFPAVVLGIVQGIGEFLPISSSAHLILVPWFFGWQGGAIGTLTFDVALHVGTLVAVVVYFWNDWLDLFRAIPAVVRWGFTRAPVAPSEPAYLLIAIIIATIPGALIGKLLQDSAEGLFRTPILLAITLAVMGFVLWFVDWRMARERSLTQLRWRDAFLIGLAQAAAIVPGFSRSGTTITAGRLLGFERTAAARFSFLLSAPITLAAILAKLPDMLAVQASEWPAFAVGVLISGLVGAIAIHLLLSLVRRIGFGVFAIYRFALAITIVLVYFMRQ